MSTQKKNILVIEPLPGIGDLMWFLPHLKALGPVTLLTKPRTKADVFKPYMPFIKDIIWVEKNPGPHDGFLGFLKLVRTLRHHHFDEVWILHHSPFYAMLAWAAGIPVRYGPGDGRQAWFLTNTLTTSARRCTHPLLRYAHMLENAGIPVSPKARLDYPFPAKENHIVLCIGGSNGQKYWSNEAWQELIQKLSHQYNTSFVLTGILPERSRAQEIVHTLSQDIQARCTLMFDQPLDQVIDLLAKTQVCIGADTGVVYVAARLGCPAISLFTNPKISEFMHPAVGPLLPVQGLFSHQGTFSSQSILKVLDCIGEDMLS